MAYEVRSGARSPTEQQSEAARSSVDCNSQSLMSVTKHLMPNEASIENYKNELKKCLKENILVKKEINRLKKLKKEQDS